MAPVVGPDDPRRFTDSGIEVKTLYTSADLPADLDLGEPGEFPYTRGVHARDVPQAHVDDAPVRRLRVGEGVQRALQVPARERLAPGLSMAFDLPTQLGLDSDDPRCLGEVGRTGVAIDTLDDMRTAFDGIPLDEVSTSMTINAPAAVLLLLYELVAEEQGVASEQLRGTVQNDILKEYIARGNFIYPPEPSMRLTTDLFAYCRENIPKWNTVSISGYHFREKGAQRRAGGRVHARERHGVRAGGARRRPEGRRLRAAPGLLLQRPQQRLPGGREVPRRPQHVGARDEASASARRTRSRLMLRFHTQTGGVTLTAQQPMNNIVRVALQGFAAVCGGTQSLHTNGFDEALALPSERAAKLALRTQQVDRPRVRAPPTPSTRSPAPTTSRRSPPRSSSARWALIEKVDEQGGSVEAIAFIKNEIEESAFGYHERYRTEQDVVVGVNEYVEDSAEVEEILSRRPRVRARRSSSG